MYYNLSNLSCAIKDIHVFMTFITLKNVRNNAVAVYIQKLSLENGYIRTVSAEQATSHLLFPNVTFG